MIKKIILGLLISVTILISGCIMVGDGVTNRTNETVRLNVVDSDGNLFQGIDKNYHPTEYVTLPPLDMLTTGRGPFDKGRRIQHVEAFHLNGEKIGAFDRKDVPNKRGRYGKFILFVVLEDGVFPVPQKHLGKDFKLDKAHLEIFLQEERDYEAKLK